MTLQVREIVVRALIVPDGKSEEATEGAAEAGANNGVTQNEELITMCIERVLEILKDKHGR